MNRGIGIAIALVCAGALTLSAGVKSVTARQRWPWNGKVDIVYELESRNSDAVFEMGFACKDGTNEVRMTSIGGEGAAARVTGTGIHALTWDAGTDYAGKLSENVTYGITAREIEIVSYMKVDLGSGAVDYVETLGNKTDWTDADRSDYLWLRKVPAGTFMMGSSTNETKRRAYNEIQHGVKLSSDFYIGVFELTKDQYVKIDTDGLYHDSYGSLAAGEGLRAADKISYADLRGQMDWPLEQGVATNSFLGLLQARCGGELAFDLPTEAQWEYACRSPLGTDGRWNDGSQMLNTDVDANLDRLAWYDNNAPSYASKVGEKAPNGYGLYDMHGNLYEWCLDWYMDDISGLTNNPVGATSGSTRVCRGGDWYGGAEFCRAAYRFRKYDSVRDAYCGARVVLTLPDVTYMKVDLVSGEVVTLKTFGNKTDWTDADKTDYLWLRRVSAGTFTRSEDHRPHQVTLTRDFYAGVFELTEGQYNRIMGAGETTGTLPKDFLNYATLRGGDKARDFPVKRWVDEGSVIYNLRKRIRWAYELDLPTEAQWEYASKAGTCGTWNDGSAFVIEGHYDSNLDRLAWYYCNSDLVRHPVGQKLPNRWGLYDMHGNIAECCSDFYDSYDYQPAVDPEGPETGFTRSARCGYFSSSADTCKSTCRSGRGTYNENNDLGARIFLTVPDNYMRVNLNTGRVTFLEEAPREWTAADKSDYLWLRKIPAGAFTMGSSTNEIQRLGSSEDQHAVTLNNGFYMGVFELTRDQYNKIDPGAAYHGNFLYPSQTGGLEAANMLSYADLRGQVAGATWPTNADHRVDSASFLGLLRARCNNLYDFDLPTEAQWEFACRGVWGEDGKWNDGSAIQDGNADTNLDRLGWYGENSDGAVHEVGLKAPNSSGLYDMHGNVLEWCLDWYQSDITGMATDPAGPETGSSRLQRGGYWGEAGALCRSACRLNNSPASREPGCGARVVVNLKP